MHFLSIAPHVSYTISFFIRVHECTHINYWVWNLYLNIKSNKHYKLFLDKAIRVLAFAGGAAMNIFFFVSLFDPKQISSLPS